LKSFAGGPQMAIQKPALQLVTPAPTKAMRTGRPWRAISMSNSTTYPVPVWVSTPTEPDSRPRRKSFALAKKIARADRDEILNAIDILGEDYLFNRFFGVQR
jgi:hypothetical protein